jgi:plastocyanin
MATAPTFDLAGPPAMTGSLNLSLDSTSASLRMNDSKDLTLTVTPQDGFDGIVTLAAENLPAGVTATFTPPGGMLSGTAPMTVKVTLKSASDTKPAAGMALDLKATSGTITATTPLTVDVTAELLVIIPKGVDIGTSSNPDLTAFGAQSIQTYFVTPGTKVTFINEDSINHEIHSDGTLGISHEGGPLMADGANSYTQTFNGSGTFNFRCHIHPNMKGQIVVQPIQ